MISYSIARRVNIAILLMAVLFQSGQVKASVTDKLLADLTRHIPERSSQTLTGSQFVNLTLRINEQKREKIIEEQILKGNIPDFLRQLKPVKLQKRMSDGRLLTATIFVTPDYLAIGSEDDFIRTPMDYHTASLVASRFGCILPTRKMVDAIYNQSKKHFTPQTMQPGSQMRSTDYYQRHNEKIQRQQHSLGITAGDLVAGHKKDVVISNRLLRKPGRIAIYGWHRAGGKPIQPLSTVHGAGYADYSHGIRLVSDKVMINSKFYSIYDILKDPELASLLSDEGPLIVGNNPKNSVGLASQN